jgi:RNA polymerase sigma factor (sigma-70 family)
MLTRFRFATRPREASSPAPEDLFLERYQSLLTTARHLTRGDTEDARDLVQDAYVHFVLGSTPLESIADLDAYLHTMLRHLHVSQIRRRARHPQIGLNALDFDTADFALRTADSSRRPQVIQELRMILDHACARCDKSKASSVLLLRYFHGYYVREIAQVLKVSTRVVDNLLHVARREARAVSDDPSASAVMSTKTGRRTSAFTAESLEDLRAALFAFAHDCCYQPAWFDACYTRDASVPLEASTLAALVTCGTCLDQVNLSLGLPPLAERYPTDMLGVDRRTPPGDGCSPGGGMGARNIARLRRRVTDVTEHRPRELFVAVNGFVVGSQIVHGNCTEQTISVTSPGAVGFVEVFSEQHVPLLFLMAEPPPAGTVAQRRRTMLSEGRSLDVEVSFSDAWPSLRIAYRDPQWSGAGPPMSVADEPESKGKAEEPVSPDVHHAAWWRRLGRATGWEWPPSPRSVPVTAVLLLTAWIGIQYFRGTPELSAREVLRQAAVAESAQQVPQGVVRHRVFDFEERRVNDGTLLSRSRLDWWERSGGDSAVRRYHHDGALLSLSLTTGGRKTVLYRPGIPPTEAQGTDPDGLRRAVGSGDLSGFVPSAHAFASVVGGSVEGTMERTATVCTLEYRVGSGSSSPGLIRAVLQLTPDSLRPISQSFVLAAPTGLREYRFVERLLETSPERDAARSSVFEPEPLLVPKPMAVTTPSAGLPSVLSVDEQTALTVEALFLLDQTGATLGDDLRISARASGVSVGVLVNDADRKGRILETLRPLALHPAVRLDVKTIGEASREHPHEAPRVSAREVAPERSTFHAQKDLERHLSRRLSGESSDFAGEHAIRQEASNFTVRALHGARQALLHAWALQHLLEFVPGERAESLEGSLRAKWRSMVRQHSLAFLRATELLRLEVEPVFFPSPQESASRGNAGKRSEDVAYAIPRLVALAIAQEEAVRSAFTLGTDQSDPFLAVRTEQFWQNVRRAEMIAKGLAEIE